MTHDVGSAHRLRATGAVIRDYVWLGLTPVATYGAGDSTGARPLTYLHADHLGRPTIATDTQGRTVWEQGIVTPFGLQVSGAGAQAQALMFPGQYADVETGYFENWHRSYDPTLGRYLQSDPIGLDGGLNRYAYVGGNPVGYVDPTGLQIAFPPGYAIEQAGLVSRSNISRSIRTRKPQLLCAGLASAAGAYSYAIYMEAINPLANIDSLTIKATQTCPDPRKDELQTIKNSACNRPRKCNGQTSAADIQTNILRNQECIQARLRVMNICFEGGDRKHANEVVTAQKTLLNCLAVQ